MPAFQVKSLRLKLNCQNDSYRDINPNRNYDLPINDNIKAKAAYLQDRILFSSTLAENT